MMKILYITDQFYLHGGIEKILASKVNSLIRDFGCEVHLLTSSQGKREFVYPLDSSVEHYDLGIDYNSAKSLFSPSNGLKLLLHLHKIKRYITKIRPDVIVSPAFSNDQYFLPYLHRNIPKIKEIHFSGSILENEQETKLTTRLIRKFYKNYNRVVVLNEDEKKYFPEFCLEIIPNFVDCSFVLNDKKEKVVMAAGRIAPVKQFDHLLEAWAKISQRFPEWILKIFGSGEDKYVSDLKALQQELNLSSVIFAGSIPDLISEMRKTALFAMTSSSECFPMVLLEAKCAGLPVVSYDAPNGPRNIIEKGKDGLIVEHNDIGKFAEAMASLMHDYQLRQTMSYNALNNSKKFQKQEIMQSWMQIFNKILNEKRN